MFFGLVFVAFFALTGPSKHFHIHANFSFAGLLVFAPKVFVFSFSTVADSTPLAICKCYVFVDFYNSFAHFSFCEHVPPLAYVVPYCLPFFPSQTSPKPFLFGDNNAPKPLCFVASFFLCFLGSQTLSKPLMRRFPVVLIPQMNPREIPKGGPRTMDCAQNN